MFEEVCGVLVSYSPQDFGNWMTGLGNLMLGVGTLFLAYAAIKKIPDTLRLHHKDKELVSLYQKVVYRMYRDVEASEAGMAFSLPKGLPQLTDLLFQKYPQIGSRVDADRLMDDLMLDDYFKYVEGNATVLKTAKWNPKDRTKMVEPKVSELPPKNDGRA